MVKRISLFVVLASALAIAQSNAVLVGMITTSSGEAVRGTRIVLVEVQSGVRYETTTDELGIYAFSLLPAGLYRLEAARHGFLPRVPDTIVLKPGEKRSWRLLWDQVAD
jgi:hypothetical protein